MSGSPKVVVLTPVRNEAWILNRFLAVTSQFADAVVVSDQGSTDGSRNIYKDFAKVHMIDNPDVDYDEASRQRRLIEAARGLVPGPRVLLALDSDEILAADAPHSEGWRRMLQAKPGTVVHLEKPDLLGTPHRAIRYKNPWPLGYVDDGCEHTAQRIHSIRVPQPAYAEHLRLDDVKVLHYALTRSNAQKSKMRYYSVLENVNRAHRFYQRRAAYSTKRQYARDGSVEPSPPEWFKGWEDLGIDMFTVRDERYNWQDYEVLRQFKKYGVKRFWIDDIWDIDWEDVRQHALAKGEPGMPDFEVQGPPSALSPAMGAVDVLYRWHVARSRRRAAERSGEGKN